MLYYWWLKLGLNDLERLKGNFAFKVINCHVRSAREFEQLRIETPGIKGSKRRVSSILHLMQVLSTCVHRGHRRHGGSGGKSIILAVYVPVYACVCACRVHLTFVCCDETVRWFAISHLFAAKKAQRTVHKSAI